MALRKIKFGHIGVALLPVLFTPAIIYALAEGWVDFGGGEKDIVLALPYFLWATIFFVTSTVLILKRWELRRWLMRSTAFSALLMFVLWTIAFSMSWLGIA